MQLNKSDCFVGVSCYGSHRVPTSVRHSGLTLDMAGRSGLTNSRCLIQIKAATFPRAQLVSDIHGDCFYKLFAVAKLLLCAVGLTLVTATAVWPQGDSAEQLLAASEAADDAGKLSEAESLVRQAIAIAEAEQNAQVAAAGQRQLGRLLTALNRYPEAEAALQRSLTALEPLGNSESLARTLTAIALLHRYRADYPSALESLRRAHQIFEEIDDKAGLQSTYHIYGVIYDLMGQQDDALEWHLQALELARELDYAPGIADGVYALGEVHRELGEHDVALEYFRESLSLDEASGISRNVAYSRIKVGATLTELKQTAEARTHYQAALALFEKSNTPRDYQWARAHLAYLGAVEGDVDPARDTLEDVLARSVAADWPRLANHAREWLVRLECKAGHTEVALVHLDKVLQDVLQQQALGRAMRLYDMKSQCLESAGLSAQALKAVRERDVLESRLFDSFRTSVIAAMQGEAEFERALELAQKDKALAELALERETTRRLVGFAALVTLFLLAFLLYGRLLQRRQNRRLSEEVREKTSALTERNAELEDAYQAVERASVTDPLTGLHNRRFLEDRIENDTARALRLYANWDGNPETRPTDADLVFFMVDMDNFKSINDRLGHAAGDAVLSQVSLVLKREFREADLVVRWGGEEFLVVARFIDHRTSPAIAQRVCAEIASHAFRLDDGSVFHCTCSIGFAAYPLSQPVSNAATWQDVVELADQALYAVKQGPRNGWQGYFMMRPLDPKRPMASWVPTAVESGTLQVVRSFNPA